MRTRTQTPIFLPADERDLAAKYLALSNLASPEPRSAEPEEVERAWRRCVEVHACEGIDVSAEYRAWRADLERGDPFAAGEWGCFKAAGGAK